jgi:hypothetical protein
MTKANHQANIVKITEVLKHGNADTLDIIPIGEYQVVSKSGQFKVGDLAVYIQPDSVVPQTEPFRFIWEPYMCVPAEDSTAAFVVPEKRRRITVRKFRGEWSEGLLLPVTDFWAIDHEKDGYSWVLDPSAGYWSLAPGGDVSNMLGITHYDPDAGKETKGDNSGAPKLKRKYPRSVRGWVKFIYRRVKNALGFYDAIGGAEESVSLGIPVYDVDAFKNYPNVFTEHEPVIVTEKIHGSNARYIFLDGVMYAGSRTLWKAPTSNCIWRKALKANPWIEEWCRVNEGYVLWGEVTPTQGNFEYGSKEPQFFPFDIRKPDGNWLDPTDERYMDIVVSLIGRSVPVLYQGPFDLEKIKSLVDGPSKVKGATNIREGIVIKSVPERHVRGVGRAQLKIVSNKFLEKDSK